MSENRAIDVLWDDNPVDITSEANFIWSIANKLRGSYMPDKYGDVIIPMTIIRRFECALEQTRKAVADMFEKNLVYPAKAMQRLSGYQFYNTSRFTLAELCNDADHIAANFVEYINSFSSNVKEICRELNMTSLNRTKNSTSFPSINAITSGIGSSVWRGHPGLAAQVRPGCRGGFRLQRPVDQGGRREGGR